MPAQQEKFRVSGDDLVRKVKEIIKEGNARTIIIENEKGQPIIQLPLTIGAIAALVTNCTLVVVKR